MADSGVDGRRVVVGVLGGLRVLTGAGAEQEDVVEAAIRAAKAGDRGDWISDRLAAVGASLARRGAQVIIAGCTEIPLAVGERCGPLPVLDPTRVLPELGVSFGLNLWYVVIGLAVSVVGAGFVAASHVLSRLARSVQRRVAERPGR